MPTSVGDRAGRGRWRLGLGLVAGVVGVVVVAMLVMNPPSEVVARTGIASDRGEEIRVRCGPWGASGDSVWGGGAGVVCQDAAPRRLVVAGVVAVVAGTSMLVVASQRRWDMPSPGKVGLVLRCERGVGSVLVALGLSAAGGGLAMQLVPDQITRLTTDDEPLVQALSDSQIVASFEVVSLGPTAVAGTRNSAGTSWRRTPLVGRTPLPSRRRWARSAGRSAR